MTYLLGSPVRYYDPQGQPTDRQYGIEPIEERRVARTDDLTWEGRPAYVSTILMPCMIVVQGPEVDKPFETALRTADTEDLVLAVRLPTREEAEGFHEALVALVRSDKGREALAELARVQDDGE